MLHGRVPARNAQDPVFIPRTMEEKEASKANMRDR